MLANARRAYRKLYQPSLPAEGTLTFVATPEEAATGVDFVQESAPERMELKQMLLQRASAVAPAHVVEPHIEVGGRRSRRGERHRHGQMHDAVLAAGGQSLSLAGEPVTVEEEWRQGFPKLEEFAISGDLLAADMLLMRLDALHEDNDTSSLAAMGKLENLGDTLAPTHPDAARWFYRMASQRFRLWVSSASSGGEGLAHSAEPDTAALKLAALG